MDRREYRRQAMALLTPRYGDREAESIALLVAFSIAGVRREDFVLEPSVPIDERAMRAVEAVADGRPVQYIIGESEFCGIPLKVGESVLIPRPETEELVAWILQENVIEQPRILDVGTGSGAIAIALGKALPEARITAVDISEAALEIACTNALINNVLIEFINADILSKTPAGEFDIVASNPPYIPAAERAEMASHVGDHEPGEALFVPDDDPLLFYRAIGEKAQGGMLKKGGRLYFEVHENYAEQVAQLLENQRFTAIEIRDDLNEKPRMIRCRRP